MKDAELLRNGAPPCPGPGCTRPKRHEGGHGYRRLTCEHAEANFIGLPGRAGKCRACRKVVRLRAGVPGKLTHISKADIVEASTINVDDPSTWPGQGIAAVVQPSRPAGLPVPPPPPHPIEPPASPQPAASRKVPGHPCECACGRSYRCVCDLGENHPIKFCQGCRA